MGVVCSGVPAWKQLWSRWFKTYKYTQNSYSTGVEPTDKKDGQSSLELGKVESIEGGPNAEQS